MAAGLVATSPGSGIAAAQTGDCSPGSSWPSANSSLASQVMTLINQHRAGLGEGQLSTSPALTASAVWKARHMAAFNYFAHDDAGPPTTTTPARSAADRVATCGYGYSWGENIAYGFPDAASAVNAWLNSAGHKANIENASYVVTGIGVATSSSGATYWVQDFGVVADGGGSPPPPPPPTTTTTAPPPSTTTSSTPPTTTSSSSPTKPSTSTQTTTTTGGSTTAPGAHGWTIAPVRLLVASRRLGLSTAVVGASGATPATAAVKCSAHIGAVRLRVVANAYAAGLARCAWRLPRLHRAHPVGRGWIVVRSGNVHVRRSFAVKLR